MAIKYFIYTVCPPYHLSCTPSDCAAGAAVGHVTFTVVYFVNPDPREDQWNLEFLVSINSTMTSQRRRIVSTSL